MCDRPYGGLTPKPNHKVFALENCDLVIDFAGDFMISQRFPRAAGSETVYQIPVYAVS